MTAFREASIECTLPANATKISIVSVTLTLVGIRAARFRLAEIDPLTDSTRLLPPPAAYSSQYLYCVLSCGETVVELSGYIQTDGDGEDGATTVGLIPAPVSD